MLPWRAEHHQDTLLWLREAGLLLPASLLLRALGGGTCVGEGARAPQSCLGH